MQRPCTTAPPALALAGSLRGTSTAILFLCLQMLMVCADRLLKVNAREAVADRVQALPDTVAAVDMVLRVAGMGSTVLGRDEVDMAHLDVQDTAHLQVGEGMGLHHEAMAVL